MGSLRGFQSSVHDQYQSNAQAYDKSLLQKLDARRGSDNTTPPRGPPKHKFGNSANNSPTSRIAMEHRHPTLKPLSLPLHTGKPGLAESPLSKWGDSMSQTSSPVNPFARSNGISQYDYRSPSDTAELDRSPLPYIRRSGSGSVMSIGDDASSVASRSRDGYDQRRSPDQDADFPMEEASLTRLQIEDHSSRYDLYSPGSAAGQKRRASSPPRDEGPSLHTVGSASDLFRRRESASRASPGPNYHIATGSVSSTASCARSGSYVSTLSLAATSMTGASSYGRASPGVSPGTTDTSLDSPYMTSMSLNPSPRSSLPRTNHQRAVSESRPLISSRKMPDTLGHVKHNSAPKVQGVFICECCPKKPKKFDTQEELKYALHPFHPHPFHIPLLTLLNYSRDLTFASFQYPRTRKTIRMRLLPQPLQKQKRSRATPKLPPHQTTLLVLRRSLRLRRRVPPHAVCIPPDHLGHVRLLRRRVPPQRRLVPLPLHARRCHRDGK